MYRRGRPFVFESGKGCGWGGLANFVLADFQHGQEQVENSTGLSAVIRQKSHVLENFSISVNNKILK